MSFRGPSSSSVQRHRKWPLRTPDGPDADIRLRQGAVLFLLLAPRDSISIHFMSATASADGDVIHLDIWTDVA